jgi:hypothetical protein
MTYLHSEYDFVILGEIQGTVSLFLLEQFSIFFKGIESFVHAIFYKIL